MGDDSIVIIIVTVKSWNVKFTQQLKRKYPQWEIHSITTPDEFTYEKVRSIEPNYIFFPHWSWKIPKKIYENFECIIFHMTDLPYGRGGSPLQNLIVRGHKQTKISAVKVIEKFDAGGVYLKANLSLCGTADEILMRASMCIFNQMIPRIIKNDIQPISQKGKPIIFKRRKESDGELKPEMTLEMLYDYIRMLDGEEYPNAFISFGKYRLSFKRASLKKDRVIATVEIQETKNK